MTISHAALAGTHLKKSRPYLEVKGSLENVFDMDAGIGNPSIALIHEDAPNIATLRNHFEMLGCRVTPLTCLENLLPHMRQGKFFDSITLLTPSTIDIDRLRAIKELSDAHIFCVLENIRFDSIRRKNEIFFRLNRIVLTSFIAD